MPGQRIERCGFCEKNATVILRNGPRDVLTCPEHVDQGIMVTMPIPVMYEYDQAWNAHRREIRVTWTVNDFNE